jgi:hypothetical protein
MNEDEILSFDYKNPNDWCKLGVKISGFNNNAVTGTIIDLDILLARTIVYVQWSDVKLNTGIGKYRKYNKDYLTKEINKGNIWIKNDQ